MQGWAGTANWGTRSPKKREEGERERRWLSPDVWGSIQPGRAEKRDVEERDEQGHERRMFANYVQNGRIRERDIEERDAQDAEVGVFSGIYPSDPGSDQLLCGAQKRDDHTWATDDWDGTAGATIQNCHLALFYFPTRSSFRCTCIGGLWTFIHTDFDTDLYSDIDSLHLLCLELCCEP